MDSSNPISACAGRNVEASGASELQEQPGSVSHPVLITRGGSVDGRRPWARTTSEPLRFPQAQLGACWATPVWVPGVPQCLEPPPSPAPAGVPILLKLAFLVVCGCLSWEPFTNPKRAPHWGRLLGNQQSQLPNPGRLSPMLLQIRAHAHTIPPHTQTQKTL